MDFHEVLKIAVGANSAQTKRAAAVAAALEIIKTKAGSGAAANTAQLMNNLSDYADKIQAALKVK